MEAALKEREREREEVEEEQRREVERADMVVVVVGRTAEHQALPYTLREHTTTHKKN